MDTELKITDSKSAWNNYLFNLFYSKAGAEVADFVLRNINDEILNSTPYEFSNGAFHDDLNMEKVPLLVDFRDANRVKDLTKHFSGINLKLADEGVYIGCFQSNSNWKQNVLKKHNRGLAYVVLLLNYVFRNLAPGWKQFDNRGKYFINTFYQDNSLAEVLGRLVFCGFEIINYKEHDSLTYFILRKKTAPRTDVVSTSRFIVKLNRVGKGGKMIRIYKVRSMFPFSEFLQDYVVRINGYDKIGKPNNDFRLTSCGKIIRKLWIDEIPQLINLIKGDIKVVGVRPISRYGFNALPKDLQDKRIRYKPGLIPPSVSLRIKGFKGVINAERQYLDEMERRPLTTDIRYFFRAVYNIVTLRVKSS